MQKIVVVGGNGFIGSAVCKAALARGMQVTSISSSGKPYRTAKGHTPAWVHKVTWHAANALRPTTYAHILRDAGTGGVVHTLGTLFEDGGAYKGALRGGDAGTLVGALLRRVGGGKGNPLEPGGEDGSKEGSYEVVNRDAALRVCETFLDALPPPSIVVDADVSCTTKTTPFVYISAEDVFRPLVPARYITTKREAEAGITHLLQGRPDVRGVFIRPSLVYHPHHRPLTTPFAALLDLSCHVHAALPSALPSPASVLRRLGSALTPPLRERGQTSALDSVANALTTPPIHVEQVAEAVCVALDTGREDVRGAVGVRAMRELIGWGEEGRSHTSCTGRSVEEGRGHV